MQRTPYNLFEHYINLFQKDEKEKYADKVWEILVNSYAKIGGIKGNGFENKQSMIEKIPFWKIVRKNGQIVTVILYKDKNGRKSVAIGTDGTPTGKEELAKILRDDLKRSYMEISGPTMKFMIKTVGLETLKKYALTPDEAQDIMKDDDLLKVGDDDDYVREFPELKDFFYQRNLGGSLLTKMCLGTPKIKIH